MQDLISIIIPCYNAAKTIDRTIRSVLEQNYENLQIIIINDGSCDKSNSVISKFKMVDSRIEVYNQKNSGVSVARNNGLKQAKGDYIVFLDADDNYTTPFALSNMMQKLKETDADMVVCNFTHPCFEQFLDAGVYDLTNKIDFLKFYQDFFAFAMPWNKITKRKCLTEDFIEGIKFTEDEIFNLFNLKNLKKVVVMNDVYHNYYCAPYNPNEEASAVNSIYSSKNFSKNTIWYMAMQTNNFRNYAFNTFFKEMKNEMQYVRVFDFFFWDFFLMAKNSIHEDIITQNCVEIFKEELFLNSLKDKQRYGLKLKEIEPINIKNFVHLAYNSFIDIKTCNKKLSMYKVFLGLFASLFYEVGKVVDCKDILAKVACDLQNNSNVETIYVNRVFSEFFEQ